MTNDVHTVVLDDQDHPPNNWDFCTSSENFQADEICQVCVSDTKVVLHDVGEGEKLFHLFHQSAKLVIAYGQQHTSPV